MISPDWPGPEEGMLMNRLRVPVIGGVAAVLSGIGATFAGPELVWPEASVLASAAWLATLHLLPAAVLGSVWPRPSWAWGIWVSLPLVILLVLSLGFAGHLRIFVRHDLLPLVAAVGGALLGGWTGALIRNGVGDR